MIAGGEEEDRGREGEGGEKTRRGMKEVTCHCGEDAGWSAECWKIGERKKRDAGTKSQLRRTAKAAEREGGHDLQGGVRERG